MQPIGRLGKIGSWFLVVAHTAVLAPEVVGEPLLLNADCCQPAPATSDPAVWGFVGLTGYPTGKHEAPNGLAFDRPRWPIQGSKNGTVQQAIRENRSRSTA